MSVTKLIYKIKAAYLYTLCCPCHRSTWDLQDNSHNFTLSTLVSGKYSCRRQQIFLFLALYFLTTSGFVFVLYVHMALYCLTFEHIYILYDAKLFIMVNKMSISSPTFMKTCLPKNLSICNPIRYVKSESCQLTCSFIENFIFFKCIHLFSGATCSPLNRWPSHIFMYLNFFMKGNTLQM